MNVLVDSSVWIAYFRGDPRGGVLDSLLEDNVAAVNELILAELLPPLRLRRQTRLASLLRAVRLIPLHIDWEDLVERQVQCLRRGLNKIGIPDLMIAQQALLTELPLVTLDKHFNRMAELWPLSLGPVL